MHSDICLAILTYWVNCRKSQDSAKRGLQCLPCKQVRVEAVPLFLSNSFWTSRCFRMLTRVLPIRIFLVKYSLHLVSHHIFTFHLSITHSIQIFSSVNRNLCSETFFNFFVVTMSTLNEFPNTVFSITISRCASCRESVRTTKCSQDKRFKKVAYLRSPRANISTKPQRPAFPTEVSMAFASFS